MNHASMGSTGPEWKMNAANPSQDDLKKWAAYCCSRYTGSTDTVWMDDNGANVSMAMIFPKQDGQLGTNPTIFIPAIPTLAELQDPVLKVTSMAKYKRDSDLVASIERHIRSASVNISQMLLRTISTEMTTLLRGTINGIALMDDLSNPLRIINYIMSTDYSQGSQLVTNPVEQYHKAKAYFDSPSVKQKEGESSSVFAVRFNAEYQKVSQLAMTANLQAHLLNAQLLTYAFLDKMSKRYDQMKSDYDKGNRIKPTTIAGVIVHALYWDAQLTVPVTTKYTPAEKAAYALQVQAKKNAKAAMKSCQPHVPGYNANIAPVVSKYKCIMHKTDLHVWNDPACKKAKEAYRAKKDAEKAAEKSA